MEDLKKRVLELNSGSKAELALRIREKMDSRARLKEQKCDYDVVILGGGLAGSTLARQLILQKKDISVLVLEKREFPHPEAAFKVGESASEVQAHYYGKILGLEKHCKECQIEKGGARYFFPYDGNEDISRRLEVGLKRFPPVPGYQLDRGRFENHLYNENTGLGVQYLDGCRVGDISINSPHKITCLHKQNTKEITARWIVDASGRSAILKRKLDLREPTEHSSNAVWMRVASTIDVDTWSDNAAWKTRTLEGLRKVGTTHLMGEGYWVWIILLPDNATSVGIVADPAIHPLEEFNQVDKFIRWLEKYEPQCARAVVQNRELIKDFLAIQHFSHGCKRVFSKERWCITGDAGVFLDPFYSPGGDFIAMQNSLICDLILKDSGGKNIDSLAEQYNFNFLNLFKLYLATYQDQYPVMGNPQVMLAKIIWDWAIYWAVNAFLFFNQNRLFDWNWFLSVQDEMTKFNKINTSMQSLFKRWNKVNNPAIHDRMFSLLDLAFLYELHTGLVAELDDDQVVGQLKKNILTLEILSEEYTQFVEQLQNAPGSANPDHQYFVANTEKTPDEDRDFVFSSTEMHSKMQFDLKRIWLEKAP